MVETAEQEAERDPTFSVQRMSPSTNQPSQDDIGG